MQNTVETLFLRDGMGSSERHLCGDTDTGIGNTGSESSSGQQRYYPDTRHVYPVQTQSSDTRPMYPISTESPDNRQVCPNPAESRDNRQVCPNPAESRDNRQVYPSPAESRDTRQMYPMATESLDTRQVYPHQPESPDTCQTSQVSSSVSECLLYKEHGKTDSQESNWDINDPDIPARIEQHVSSYFGYL